jgi:hypothetical protein
MSNDTSIDFLFDTEHKLQFTLPKVLKNVLDRLRYNTKLAWENFNEQDLNEIEREA